MRKIYSKFEAKKSCCLPVLVVLRQAVRSLSVTMGNKRARGKPGRPKKRKFHGKKPMQAENEDESAPENIDDSLPNFDHLLAADNDSEISSGAEFSDGDSSSGSSSDSDEDSETESVHGYRLVDLECLQDLLSKSVCCQACHGPITLKESTRQGLASCLVLICQSCEAEESQYMSGRHNRVWEVNRRAVFGMRWIGRGHGAMLKLGAALNIPVPMTFSAYQGHAKALHKSAKVVAQQSMIAAATQVQNEEAEVDDDADDDVTKTTVTYDGTWMRRGYASLYGVFVAMSWNTGKVLDVETLSRFCHQCAHFQHQHAKKELTDDELQHKLDNHECRANTKSSAPAMECEAALKIWRRSEETRQLQYTVYIGDGDTKSYKAVHDAYPYGPEVEIAKEECVGHVQKRVGHRLRKLKKDLSGKKLADGGKISGRGRLTDQVIDKLQAYYGMAVRGNKGDLQAMAKAIWASLMHRVSTDEMPQHQYCPPGSTSWCKWQQQQAGGPVYKHQNTIPDAIFRVIKPTYMELSTRSLLQRCLRGATQNQNECFNGIVWQLCPKTGFCSSITVETAVYIAVGWFNDGAATIEALFLDMGLPVGDYTVSTSALLDGKRRSGAARKQMEHIKLSRKKRRRLKKGGQDVAEEVEGVPYEAGAH